MRSVALPRTEIHVSRLSFGTASLHHLVTSSRRQELLAAAFDHAFTHFDTAPYYGFGIAEEELGRFLRGRRGGVTVATKVGLYPPRDIYPNTASVWLQKAAGGVFPTLSRPIIDWSIAAAARSLDRSLRRLRTDWIDLLLLHEPASTAVESEIFLDWLKEERSKGKIRAWGLAGHAECMNTWLSTNHPLGMVLQVQDSLMRKEADQLIRYGRDLQITYGYLSANSALPRSLAVTEILERAMQRNAIGSIVVSTRRLEHMSELAAVAERNDGDDN